MKEESMNKNLKYGIIEVTRQCQLRCPGCYMVRTGSLNGGQMSLEEAIRVLDVCREYRGEDLETMDILGGEPLLWPYLKPYIEELLRRGILPWIFTNMIAITPELVQWLYERRVCITGKLNINPDDAENLQLQSKLIGEPHFYSLYNDLVNLGAKKMIEGINIFMQAGYKSPLFKLENLVRKVNVKMVPSMYKWCLEKGVDPDIELLGCGEGISDAYWEIGPTPKELAEMILEIQKVRADLGLEKKRLSCLTFSVRAGSLRPDSILARMARSVPAPTPTRPWQTFQNRMPSKRHSNHHCSSVATRLPGTR